jgi:carboxyl-terminal processing protease
MSNRSRIPLWILPMNVALGLAVGVLGVWVWLLSSRSLPRAQLDALELVFRQISAESVDPPSGEDLMWSAIEGMVRDVDVYSEFVRPSNVAEFDEDTTGNYVGIGIVIDATPEALVVRFPFADGPSERAELMVGDRLVAVNGQEITGRTPLERRENARQQLLGPAGTEVSVTIQRGDASFERTIERGNVHTPSVKWARLLDAERGIGYAYVKGFQQNTAGELEAAVDELSARAGGELRALIIDLRFNPGGLLDEAVRMANAFVPRGTIVTLRRRNGEITKVHEADPGQCRWPDLPLVLLVNAKSASASEVFAGAMQDYGRATLLGTRTFGKGVVQSIYSWKGLDFRLKLTTARYFTPNGRSIDRAHRDELGRIEGGIEPDREVAAPDEQQALVRRALYETQEPPARYREAVRELAARIGLEAGDPPGPEGDPQLAAALAQAAELAGAPLESR